MQLESGCCQLLMRVALLLLVKRSVHAVLPPARLLVRNTNLNATVPHALALYPLRVSGCTTSLIQQQHVLDLAPAADIIEATGSDNASQSTCVTPETRPQ